MATIVGDVTGPHLIPHLVEKIKGFPLKVKSSPKTATFKKNSMRWGAPFF